MKHVISALVCGAHTTDKKEQTHNNIGGIHSIPLSHLCVCTVELDFAIYVCRYIESLKDPDAAGFRIRVG